ncbi:MAG: tetratricopeptide repeat protein [Treponema sp.]
MQLMLGCTLIIIVSCTKPPLYYVYQDIEHKAEQKCLAELLLNEKNSQVRFALTDKIAHNLQKAGKLRTLTVFLQSVIEQEPKNIYNAYFMLRIASAHLDGGENKLAAYYFEHIIQNYPDTIVQGQSVHFICLKKLIELTDTTEKQIAYYLRLLTDYYTDIDPAYSYFMLAQAYEKQGEWQLAIQTYTRFLNLRRFDVIIPGIPDSYGYARKIVDYNASAKSWTFNTLEELIKTITAAIRTNDYTTLERCRSKVNFFAMSWKQELSETHPQPDFNLRSFMHGSGIKIASAVDASSTPYEAYLRTAGWNQYIQTWYLYFRKINFPADPAIHGRWEWAGIYYGEKL